MELQRHPLNREFTWSVPAGPYGTASTRQVREYDVSGFFVFEDAFDPDEVRRITAAIDPWEADAEAFLRRQRDGRIGIARAGEITFRPHLVTVSPVLAAFCRHPVLLGLCRDLIGPDVRLYWEQSVYKKPGMRDDFPWHQDNGYTYVEPQQYLTCWIALTDANEDNGCPWVAPGLHRLGTLAHEPTEHGFRCLREAPDALPLPLRAGSIAVFSSLTPHRTGPNRTGGVRKAYIVQYAPEGACIRIPGREPLPCEDRDRQFPVLARGEPRCDPADAPAPGPTGEPASSTGRDAGPSTGGSG